jgi:16S rRNA C1402 N4-methylase RsmH
MTRTLKALSALVLGGMLLVSATACEDKVCQEALAKATAGVEATAKALAAATAELAQTKARLAATEAALAAAKKEIEAAKAAPKPEEAAPAEAPKKGKKK